MVGSRCAAGTGLHGDTLQRLHIKGCRGGESPQRTLPTLGVVLSAISWTCPVASKAFCCCSLKGINLTGRFARNVGSRFQLMLERPAAAHWPGCCFLPSHMHSVGYLQLQLQIGTVTQACPRKANRPASGSWIERVFGMNSECLLYSNVHGTSCAT